MFVNIDSDTSLRSIASPQSNLPLSFSDSLSPMELADWLSQELVAKGLKLEASHRQLLLGEPNDSVNSLTYH